MTDQTAKAALIAAFAEARKSGADGEGQFFRDLKDNPNDQVVVEFLLDTLAALKSKDGALIPMYAAAEIARRRAVDALPRLKQIRNKLPKMSGLRDYRDSVDEAINILANAAAGDVCNCRAYASSESAPYQDDIVILASESGNQEYDTTSTYQVQCCGCGQKWEVIVDSGYHTPTARWYQIN